VGGTGEVAERWRPWVYETGAPLGEVERLRLDLRPPAGRQPGVGA
jgi:hypothetical protein